jgi:hypothetical protein
MTEETTTALAVKPTDEKGRFIKRTKAHAPTGREITSFIREYLQGRLEVSDETGKLTKDSKKRMERILDNQVFIASDATVEARSASVKAAQLLMERAYGRASASDEDRASMERAAVRIVIVTPPDLPNMGEMQPREKITPNFADAPFVDAELIQQNPRLTAEQMNPDKELKKPEPVLCECATQSPRYCPRHRPY